MVTYERFNRRATYRWSFKNVKNIWATSWENLVCDKVRLDPAGTATNARSVDILAVKLMGIILSK